MSDSVPAQSAALPSFNLIDAPWIPVVDQEGVYGEVGLRELFVRAHELREVSDPSPLATFALMRLLLTIAHRIVKGPRDHAAWRKIWEAGRFAEKAVDGYLENWRHRFDLFDRDWPFMQVGGFETIAGAKLTTNLATRLLPEIATGNNATLFDHSDEGRPTPMSPADAARALLVAQTFGLGGGKGPTSRRPGRTKVEHPYSSHAPCVGAVAVLLRRPSVFETLCANMPLIGPSQDPPFRSPDDDHPSWERQEVREPEECVPTGYLEYSSWLARYVRLIPDPVDGRVREMCFAQGAIVADEVYKSPFAFWHFDDKRGQYPVPLNPDRAVWRDSHALLSMRVGDRRSLPPMAVRLASSRSDQLSDDRPAELTCVGLANDKAKPLMWRSESLAVPRTLLTDQDRVDLLGHAIKGVESIWQALRGAIRSLAYRLLEADQKSPDTKDVTRLQDRMLQHVGYWEAMELDFRRFVVALGDAHFDAWEAARVAWLSHAKKVAWAGLGQASGFVEGSVARVGRALAFADRVLGAELAKLEPQPAQPVSNPTSLEAS